MRVVMTLVLSSFLVFSAMGQKKSKQKLEKGIYAKITTKRGAVLLRLYPEKAPLTVANFVGLAEGKLTVFDSIKIKKPFYDGLTFHRVISKANGDRMDFMIQGGDPKGNGSGGPGYKFWNEINPTLKHDKGVISMANAGPNTNGSQFFITIAPQHHLDGKYNVFGRVISGQNVVDSTLKGDTIQQIKIIKKGLKYKWFYNPTKEWKKAYTALKQKHEQERLKKEKTEAQNKVRVAEAKSKSTEEYKTYFYTLIKKDHPDAKQTSSGLVYVIRKKGTGTPPKKGDAVSLHYIGKLVFGGKFDSSYDRNKPLSFKYKITNLIPGFNEGVGLATQGEQIDLYIPYFLAYGKSGRGRVIPPYSDLIFQIKMLKVEHTK